MHLSKRSLLISAVTAALCLGTASGLTSLLNDAHASIGVCRSDPVFTLTNGMTVTLFETLTDDPSDIVGGSYVLHIPAGVSVRTVNYSGTVGSQQSFTYYADAQPNAYSATSTVLTTTDHVQMTAYMTVGLGRVFNHGRHFATDQSYDFQVPDRGDVQSTSTDGVSNTGIDNSITYSFVRQRFHGRYDATDSTASSLVLTGGKDGASSTFIVTANTAFLQKDPGSPRFTVVSNANLVDGQRLDVAAVQMDDGSWNATTVFIRNDKPKDH